MARYFNNREVELLAPAGNFDIFKEVVKLNCDAIYFGGKNLNMRLHRKDYNFSNEELIEAVKIAHEHGKKAYITVNNMYNDEEIGELKDFLLFLAQKVKPDALIVQDMSVLAFIKECKIPLSIHASVMMNVHNLSTIKALKELGVTRVVLSREATLSYSKYLSGVTDMELEYFVHGDMCVAHGGRCLYSGMLFGQSSNRGRCLKPCRWEFEVNQGDNEYKTEFPMAVKDMCMYENIPELIHGGITSFKIEGRMRDIEYLKLIITAYGDAIDRYIEDPISFDRKKDSTLLYENRKRDTSTGYAFGRPGLSNINSRFEGTGKLFSTGKVFSTATEERSISQDSIDKMKAELAKVTVNQVKKAKLSVKVNNIEQAKVCLELGVDQIYLSGDVFAPDKAFTRKEIENLAKEAVDTKIFLCMPHMTFDIQFDEYSQLLKNGLPIDGLLVTNLGGVSEFANYKRYGDYQLNILNQKAASFYKELGVGQFTISPEVKLPELISFIKGDCEAELIVHGSPTVMYLEHDLYENTDGTSNELLYLKDGAGFKHPVFKDIYGRCHMLLYKNICLLPVLKELYNAGLSNFRLEIPHFTVKETKEIVEIYQKAISDLSTCQNLYEEFCLENKNLTFGSLSL